ncbi:MAG: hypothetical protein FJ098_04385 [Deltaproteobacteria bacterium]|nr:hypothetical protein [Deltaproteobacteria bacterium]
MRRDILVAPLLLALGLPAAVGRGDDPARGAPAPGVGTDEAAVAACLACHIAIAERWARPSTHGLILDCAACHADAEPPGPGHAGTGGCDTCHSEVAHPPGASCTGCHDPHGSVNAFLVRADLSLPWGGTAMVHLTRPEGASVDGLARAGVEGAAAGTGVCEVCHASTAAYDRAGAGAQHSGAWCVLCHSHQVGFLPE